MEPIGAELERLLAPAIERAAAELEALSEEGGGCRTSFAQIVIRNADGSTSARCYASAGDLCAPGEVIFHADAAGEAFAGALERLRQKAAPVRAESNPWGDERFRALCPTNKVVALYCLTNSESDCPHPTVLVTESMAQSLGMDSNELVGRLREIVKATGWVIDDTPAGLMVCL